MIQDFKQELKNIINSNALFFFYYYYYLKLELAIHFFNMSHIKYIKTLKTHAIYNHFNL